MIGRRDLSIRQKLTLSVFVTTSVALVLVGAGFLSYDMLTTRRALTAQAEATARVIGLGSAAALLFRDAEAARETLATLRAEPQIVDACLYDSEGQLFARYAPAGASRPHPPVRAQPPGHYFEGPYLHVFQAIVLDEDRVGTLYLRRSTAELRARAWRFVGLTLAVLGAAALVAFALGARLHRHITRPLASLVETSGAIAGGNLSIRVPVESDDEIGTLARSFNHMTEGLRAIITESQGNVQAVGAVARVLRESSDAMLAEVQRQQGAIDEASESVEQVVASIHEVGANVGHLTGSAGDTTRSIVQMDASVGRIASHMDALSGSIESSSVSVVKMTSSIKEVAGSVETLDRATEGTFASLQELHTSVQQVEGNAKRNHELSERASVEAQQGMQAVGEVIVGMRQIQQSFRFQQEHIARLAGKSESIGEIVKVIDGIARQTNLLSLNAAIIASQAGEHGKAFAVVADQVKSLAERTAVSTREIASLIQSVQAETAQAVTAVNQGAERVERGVSLSNWAGQMLERIIEASSLSTQVVREIVQATEHQSRDIQHVDRAMLQVREMVQQINASTHEQDHASSEITRAVQEMRQLGREVLASTQEQSEESRRITAAAENVTRMIEQIALAAEAQKAGSDQISHALEIFREVKTRIGGRAEDMKGVVTTLASRSRALDAEIGRFKTEE